MNPVLTTALLLYVAFLIFYAAWSAFLLYHIIRFSPRRETVKAQIGIFVGVTLFLLLISVAALIRLDWSAPFASRF